MTRPSLTQLEAHDAFIARHIAPSPAEQAHMLATLGYADRTALIDAIVPANIRRHDTLPLAEFTAAKSEQAALAQLKQLAGKNQVLKSLIGQGYYNTYTPGVILRNVFENPAWYTAYTPYQPEISQGRLEAILNFQTMITDMTGLDIANASMLDEGTAAAEAMTLILRVGKSDSKVFYVGADVLPQTREIIATRAKPLGIEVRTCHGSDALEHACFGVLLQYPGVNGDIRDYREYAAALHAKGALVIAAADLLALTLITPPGEWGADVVVGNSQRFGVPLGFGGPHAGYMATRDAYKRSMPGRLVGVTVDAQGQQAYRLALQTREQHIRREKATSNICTAQVLLAVIASMYAIYHGPAGLRQIAQRVQRLTGVLAGGLQQLGFTLQNSSYFDTLTVTVSNAAAVHAAAVAAGYNLRQISAEAVGVSIDETVERSDILKLWSIFADGRTLPDFAAIEAAVVDAIPAGLLRTSAFLSHPTFQRYHAEHEMLRYLRGLADKDLALDRSMIPLGSCTMKLNATSEMVPVTWPEFSNIHPFAPDTQTIGYREMIAQLEAMLCAATGYAAVSLQPNAGSQGEYAGLLVIQAYHAARGQGHRNICLIPSSAHGTNPASASMVGLEVVVVACDERGNVDLHDLQAKAEQHSANLAAVMVTYPSTHGVFEEGIQQLCEIVHSHGGQVYVDGANMNALVGVAAPGQFGGDVSHLNLHKTFCIPHGGGGPGVGPVAVAAHLAQFLPNHTSTGYMRGENGISAVSAAAFGSASILPISWMYIAMMGAEGLKAATETAILAANYIAKRLAPHYPVLYAGHDGLVAHECILDLRPLTDATGISNEDVAKRLIDFGFHAPTMSFPVPGTLMIEPTESESLRELDRFIDAMIAIREEIAKVASAEFDAKDNPLKHAPHTIQSLLAAEWSHPYSRETAAYPLPSLRHQKYWAPVGRADNVYGDRNLFCSCVPLSDYQ
ncbi:MULTISPECIES: aminomethyl-transferring glycine dehydrogenase [unclassified Undibacterium]|uniref:aminomethyl-transferring glycine dehydrogenase n=1 Tax=unclassified Undibacterium TaxID=2630295 RepID=UPI002AC99DCC|nr:MULTISPECIES: aminomethyl-transferring glycine dehydrogenase [unclassified Undibacterium]MEB0137765.1 aminomethyl-transferring glycine dehydrogenase [Undibacterium sp. CCC2.1]MEB0174027.1 aminomethyl-transferring glycine dehydrogenase [Undibacterium sp. CCC1.1]MEB0177983.1 aminomethyl-transferring glycine dehydrogenase [Undibacterium sp. CCC3.4]MEB0217214.1 aminomethyl-transferring glycine dehydrogenase [Undibacterium sp. 5I2]WPX42340.1 aminomethyl-transferring glycine dehydrogenase [Undiba